MQDVACHIEGVEFGFNNLFLLIKTYPSKSVGFLELIDLPFFPIEQQKT